MARMWQLLGAGGLLGAVFLLGGIWRSTAEAAAPTTRISWDCVGFPAGALPIGIDEVAGNVRVANPGKRTTSVTITQVKKDGSVIGSDTKDLDAGATSNEAFDDTQVGRVVVTANTNAIIVDAWHQNVKAAVTIGERQVNCVKGSD